MSIANDNRPPREIWTEKHAKIQKALAKFSRKFYYKKGRKVPDNLTLIEDMEEYLKRKDAAKGDKDA